MLIALVIVALLAVGLLVMYVLATRSAAGYRAQAESREATLTAERDDARAQEATRATELAAARTEVTGLEAQVAKLEAQSSQLSAVVRRLTGEIDDLKATSAQQSTRIEVQSGEIATLTASNEALTETLTARAEAAEAEVEVARAALVAAEARNVGIVIGDALTGDDGEPATLWALELARSERTWRTSVAADPFATATPFQTAENPVRLAVEVEASALRENVGAFITIDWQAAPIADPARCHLVVRVAQELLEAAARNPEPLRLVVTGTDEITLRLEPLEPGGGPLELGPSSLVASDLVGIPDNDGLTVTVNVV